MEDDTIDLTAAGCFGCLFVVSWLATIALVVSVTLWIWHRI